MHSKNKNYFLLLASENCDLVIRYVLKIYFIQQVGSFQKAIQPGTEPGFPQGTKATLQHQGNTLPLSAASVMKSKDILTGMTSNLPKS